ncbi:Iron sulfur-containing domain CDGSH-type [Trinorchestia longiramus]|nr:Iron sulfur-containing domain CDGSH-type [Trinorchestia longiramus]
MMEFYKNLTAEQWMSLMPFGVACIAIGFTAKSFLDKKCGGAHVNPSIRKSEAKVVNTVDIEEIGNQKAFCRCWRSEKFPYCDGSHNKHNETTGDNVGPLLVKKS